MPPVEVAPPGGLAQLAMSAIGSTKSKRLQWALSAYTVGTVGYQQGRKLWNRYQERNQFTVSVTGDDEVYDELHEWLLERMPEKDRRSVVARSKARLRNGAVPVDSNEEAPPDRVRLFYDSSAHQTVVIAGHSVRVRVDKPEWANRIGQSSGEWLQQMAKQEEKMVFTCENERAHAAVLAFLGELVAAHEETRKPRLRLAGRWGGWNHRNDLPLRALDTVVLKNGQRDTLAADVAQFLDSEDAYNRMGVPWHRGYLLYGPPGTGKAQPLDAPVLTPAGWRPIGDLRIRDQVTGANGLPTEVTGVFDRGSLDIYRLTMSDGSSVEASGDHLWLVQTHDQRVDDDPGKVLTTEEIRAGLLDGSERAYYVPQVAPVEFACSPSLPVDPYLLGLLLGDGTFRGKVELCSADPELLDEADRLSGTDVHCTRWPDKRSKATSMGFRKATATGNPGGRGKSVLAEAITDLGLFGVTGVEKFIPAPYLTASVADRLALLQGLMDTDGGAERTATVFYSSAPRLVDDLAGLVETLGGTATISSKIPQYGPRAALLYGKTAYRVSLRLPQPLCPFRLSRKTTRWAARPHNPPVRSIVAVEYARTTLARCIAVEAADNLYVTEHCIVTHNTSLARALATEFNLDVWYIPLTDLDQDTKLLGLIAEVGAGSMLLLEDIDTLRAATDRNATGVNVAEEAPFGISAGGLFNSLDGVATPHGLITVMTTNHIDRLDPALIRPGRVDRQLHIDYLDAQQFLELVRTFLHVDFDLDMDAWDDGDAMTAADVVDVLKVHLDDPEGALLALKELVGCPV